MKPINNPFSSPKANKCFACSSENAFGLQMKFYHEDDFVICKWEPKTHFDGWKGIVHGGIQATLIDETGEWYIFSKLGRSAVTINLDIRYKNPVKSDSGEILIKARLIEYSKKIANIEIMIFDANDNLCTKATGKYFVYSEKESIEKFDFPGIDKF